MSDPFFHAIPHPRPDGPLGWHDPKLRSLCGLDPDETQRASTYRSVVTCPACRVHEDFPRMPGDWITEAGRTDR